jgi:hypothetical protein
MDTAVTPTIPDERPPLGSRFNPRIAVFVGLLVLVFGSVAWKFIDLALSSGIKDHGDYFAVDLKTMSDWEMDPFLATDKVIPAQFRALDGKRVQLIGEIAPGAVARGGVASFDLVYSVQKCCFEGSPKIQHFIKCKVVPGGKAELSSGLVKVIGTLHVGIQRDPENPNQVTSVFRVDVESVEPV